MDVGTFLFGGIPIEYLRRDVLSCIHRSLDRHWVQTGSGGLAPVPQKYQAGIFKRQIATHGGQLWVDSGHPRVVRIEKWEYSDPVVVPHPDNVSLVVNVPADISGPLSARIKWKRQRWSTAQTLDQIKTSDRPGGGRVLSAVIGLRKQIDHNPPRLLRSEVLSAGRVIVAESERGC